MADEIRKNVPNFIPMGAAGGQRVKQDDPVELDAEGKPVNPHIPQFIAKAPWYLDSGEKSSLKHQRLGDKDGGNSIGHKTDWYRRGERAGPAATKYRKGACENCGAASHKTKDCLERPRKIGAKWNGRDIQADEILQNVNLSWDAKRDKTNGYDFDGHTDMLRANFDRLQALRGGKEDEVQNTADALKPQSVADQTKSGSNSHMRIREDTASYLAKGQDGDTYNPKTRTTKTATASAGTTIDKQDFTRGTSDATAFQKLQAFAWNDGAGPKSTASTSHTTGTSAQNGTASDASSATHKNAFGDVHVQATPSQAALTYAAQVAAKEAAKEALRIKYGVAVADGDQQQQQQQERDQTYSTGIPAHLLEPQDQREYTATGKLILPTLPLPPSASSSRDTATVAGSTTARLQTRSRYVEDNYTNGHRSVFGSWYDVATQAWGYACCHELLKNAYCTAQ